VLFPPEQIDSTVEKNHGRIEERIITVLTPKLGTVSFPFVSQIFRIKRTIKPTNEKPPSIETIYGVTSLTAAETTPKRILEYNRGHWAIESVP
jgi:hypothetical protein